MPIAAIGGALAGALGGGGGLLAGAGAIGSALIGSSAASKAAKMQQRAAQQARTDMLPFMLPGQGAMGSLARLYGINPDTGEADPNQAFNEASLAAFRRSPDYQFALQEGQGALHNSQAARGMLRSGNTLRAITEHGQGLASQTFGSYRGALAQLAQIGAGAAGGAGQAAMAAGQAGASGVVGGANAWAGALGNIGNYALMQQQQTQQQQFLQNLLRPTAYSGTPNRMGAAPTFAGSQPVLPGFGGVGASPY